ncbi:MAG: lipoyl synthase [Geobacteraceae bacterium]|nr:lipoyl synthase [Geobacteraceae bacterium]
MTISRRPPWLQKKVSPALHLEMERLLEGLNLNTVCREAHCPNISECYACKRATFLILGTSCTRLCSFCNVTKKQPLPPDPGEPARVARAVKILSLAHVVVTSPTRDDLADGGASLYGATVREIRSASPSTSIELLVPDFLGRRESLETVVASGPDIIGHNVETVPRLYAIRTGADYRRSLQVIGMVGEIDPDMATKSGIMLGMGERWEEVREVMEDLRSVGCRYLSIGQYLAPSKAHYPVKEFVPPETFERYREYALSLGFLHVESGPYVRSSYLAERYGQ